MHSLKKACFLDFDHTLFNTDEFFHVDVRNSFLRFGIDAGRWEESYMAVWPQGYTLEKHVEEVCRRSGRQLPVEEMKQILQNSYSDLSQYLFSDVVPFLEMAKNKGVRLYLLSFGNEDWQRYKVSGSGIQTNFDSIFFTSKEGRKADIISENIKKFQQIIMVDNNPGELDLIKDAMPEAQTICINRVPDELIIPGDEISRLKFLDARGYLGKNWRHCHRAINKLDGILN